MGKNVLLFFMSVYTNPNNPQTNTTVIKKLMSDSEDRPDVMIALCSERVRTKETITIDGKNMTTKAYFDDVFMPSLKPEFKLHELPRLERIPVPDSLQEADQAYAIHEVVKHINSDDHLYIDMTGGMRDTAMLLITTARYLRDIRQIDTPQVLYAAESGTPNDGKNAKYVPRDCNQLYKLFDLISATDEFFSTGSAHKLQKYFDAEPTTDPNIKRLLEHINTFSSDLALCRMGNMKSDLKALGKELKSQSNSNAAPKNINDLFYKLLSQRFKRDFSKLLENKTDNLPTLTKWCVDHNLYQQALTLLVEEMPTFVCNHIFLQPTEKAWNYMTNGPQNGGKSWIYPLFHVQFGKWFIMRGKPYYESDYSHSSAEYLDKLIADNELDFDPACKDLIVWVIDDYKYAIEFRNHTNHAGKDSYDEKTSSNLSETPAEDVFKRLDEITERLETIRTLQRNVPDGVTPRDLDETFPEKTKQV